MFHIKEGAIQSIGYEPSRFSKDMTVTITVVGSLPKEEVEKIRESLFDRNEVELATSDGTGFYLQTKAKTNG